MCYRANQLLVITLLSTMSMTQLLSALEEQVSEQLSVSLKLDSKLPVSPNFSQLDLILLPPREVLMLPSVTCIRMIGDGISMILSKVAIGSVIKMPSII